jgi:hypothetical protein
VTLRGLYARLPGRRAGRTGRRRSASPERWAPEPLSFAELRAMPPPEHRWLLEQLLEGGDLLMVLAPPKAFKSHVLLQMLMTLSHGEGSLFGRHRAVGPSIPTLYVDGENGTPETRRRAVLMAAALGVADDLPLWVVPPSGARLSEPAHRDRLLRMVDERRVGLVALDPMIEVAGGVDENDNIAAHRLVHDIWDPLRERGVALVIAHHTRKGRGPHGSVGISADAARGASSVRGAAAASMVIDPRGYGRYGVGIEGRGLPRQEYVVRHDPATGLLTAVGTATQAETTRALDAPKQSVSDAVRRLRDRGVLDCDAVGRWFILAREPDDAS